MPLYFIYTMVQKSQKWPKTQIKGGPALTTPCQKDKLAAEERRNASRVSHIMPALNLALNADFE